jgi:hypothetical protein
VSNVGFLQRNRSRIPPVAHFVWFGRQFPWIYGLSLRSAALRGDLEQVVLHHADPLEDTPGWRLARQTPRVRARPLEPPALLARVEPRGLGRSLAALYSRLEAPAARANLVRAALLYLEGGVYLDTDTVTVASLRPLLGTEDDPETRTESGTGPGPGVFCGEEHLCLPASVARSRHPLHWARAGLLLALRDGLRRIPGGFRWFPAVAPLYFRAPNNAVLGGAPGHPFLRDMLQVMVSVEPARQTVRFALGTHLLTEQVAAYRGSDLAVHPPPVFYPLGPEISEHWFRPGPPSRVDPAQVLSPDTRVVHWYASVRTKSIIPCVDAAYVRANAPHQLFSALALPFLP